MTFVAYLRLFNTTFSKTTMNVPSLILWLWGPDILNWKNYTFETNSIAQVWISKSLSLLLKNKTKIILLTSYKERLEFWPSVKNTEKLLPNHATWRWYQNSCQCATFFFFFFLIQLCYLIILSKSQVTENDFVVISGKTTSDRASHASAC